MGSGNSFFWSYPNKIRVLEYLYVFGKEKRLLRKEVFSVLKINSSNIFFNVRKLEESGLVRVFREGRTILLKLTPLGRKVAKCVFEINEVLEPSHFSEVSLTERRYEK